MKLFSKSLELRIIKTICSGSDKSAYLLGKLSKDLIHTDAAKAAFLRLSSVAKKDGEIPPYSLLCEDPMLSDAHKTVLREYNKKPFQNKEIDGSIKKLRQYSSIRGLLTLAESIVEDVSQDTVDVDTVAAKVADNLSKIKSGNSDTKVWTVGKDGNTKHLVKKILKGEGVKLIPSTIEAWDSKNGGIPTTACVLMAATTGGGKSISASTICKNLVERGYRPGIWSLEMSKEENLARLMANVAEVPVHKIVRGKLTENEVNHIDKVYGRWERRAAKNGGSFMLFENDEGAVDITQALYTAKAYSVDIIIIDYIALLDGMSGDDDWRNMSEAVREAKRFARSNGIPVIVLAQLGHDGALRYSKRMLDDADIAFVWVADEEAKETGIIHITNPKARNMVPLNIDMLMEWEYTRMRDLDDKELEQIMNSREVDEPKSKRVSSKQIEGKKKRKVLTDITSTSSSIDI